MKRNYISPVTQITLLTIENHLLDLSANGSMTVDTNQSVETELVKRQDYNVWDEDWSKN